MQQLTALIQTATEIAGEKLTDLPFWLTTTLGLYSAGKLSKRGLKKLRWKLLWYSFKNKFRRKNAKKEKDIKWGLLILALLIGAGCIALIIALGGAKVFIWIGVILLIGVCAMIF